MTTRQLEKSINMFANMYQKHKDDIHTCTLDWKIVEMFDGDGNVYQTELPYINIVNIT